MSANKRIAKPAATPIPPSLQAKLAAFQANRSSTNNAQSIEHAMAATTISSPQLPQKPPPGLAQRIQNLKATSAQNRRPKPNFNLRDIDPSLVPVLGGGGIAGAGLGPGRPITLPNVPGSAPFTTPFANFSRIVDPSGALNFNGKAILNAQGVNFENGASFAINMDQLQLDVELGKGNYGTVKKVLHKPTNVAMAMKEIRLELDQAKLNAIIMELDVLHRAVAPEIVEFYGAFFIESCVYYCMEYMDAGSLDKLIQSNPDPMQTVVPAAPLPSLSDGIPSASDDSEYSFALPHEDEEVDLTNADRFAPYNSSFNRDPSCAHCNHTYRGGPVPEPVLGRIACSMVKGLKFLKDELNIIHRDVKPTNVLINRKGQVKLCDFGVSGQLDKSMARTNIGCQSYMAPERIRGESRVAAVVANSDAVSPNTASIAAEGGAVPGTAALADELYGAYTVSSDVWSLGLSIVELGLGRYPYPPETYSNVFAQLTAIVHGPPPCLPSGPPSSIAVSASSSSSTLNSSTSSSSSGSTSSSHLSLDSSDTSPPTSLSTRSVPSEFREYQHHHPKPGYSPLARDWIKLCMKKEPSERATYRGLLEHPWLIKNASVDVDVEGWVRCALQARESKGK